MRCRAAAVGVLAGLTLLLGEPAPTLAGEAVRGPSEKRSFFQRLRPFKKTTIIVTAGLSAGPFIAGASSNVGLIIRGRDSKEAQGVFWQNGADLGFVGAKRISSPTRELRGWEWNVGPRSKKHPIYGDRVGFPILPDLLSISASRTGGLGVAFSLPIPGVPFPLCRMPISIYVASPGLAWVGGKVNDGMDALTRAGARLAAPIVRPARRLLRPIAQPVARAGRAGVARLKRWVEQRRSRPVTGERQAP